MKFLFFALIGLVAGYLAGYTIKGKGFGLFWNIVIGIIGGFIGGWLFDLFNFNQKPSIFGSLVTSFIGAIILLLIINQIRKRTK
jgi:uncharacterized membrane protein YeaQ/YmgE (transglycosylase-associated protein family)